MTPTEVHDPERVPERVPAYALVLSLVALAVPMAVGFWFPDWTTNGLGMLIWLAVLVPAFLLSYYRGLRGVAVALAGGMAVITATQLGVVMFKVAEPDWTLLLAMTGAYLVVALAIGGLSELLIRERRIAQGLALVDALTGLPNRRHLEIMLASAFASAERGRAMAVVMFDLDNFKRVNDTRGHLSGDRTLQDFAKILRANTRLEDLSARFGGEEFVTVFRDTSREHAEVFAARVLDQMRTWALPWGHQTVSAGVAAYEPGMGSYELLLGAADLALYQAKDSGRDCVCVAPSSQELPHHPTRVVVPSTSPGPASLADANGLAAPSLAAPSAAAPSAAAPSAAVPAPKVAIRVWAVDDSAHMRSILKGMLARGGYDAWVGANPHDAIRRFATATPEERPDVIIADVIMPEMSGPRMIGEIMKISRHVRVIYMSGFVQSAISWGGGPGVDVAFLEKPISIQTLFAALTAVLEPVDRATVTGT